MAVLEYVGLKETWEQSVRENKVAFFYKKKYVRKVFPKNWYKV